MAEPILFYTLAVNATPGVAHATPDGSPGALHLREKRHDCMQLAGFGQSRKLIDGLQDILGTVAIPGTACTVLSGRAHMLAVGPSTWLLLADPGKLRDFPRDTVREFAAVTDFSDGRSVAFELRGPASIEVLRMHLGIDLDEAVFAPGACLATGIQAIPVVVLRQTLQDFLVLVQRSFAVSLWETLLDSAASYGVVIDTAA